MMLRVFVIGLVVLVLAPGASAQSLEERLDEDEFLRGLIDLDVPEVLDHYLRTHEPADAAAVGQLRIAAELRRVRAQPAGSRARERAVERVLELRAEQIRLHPNHPHRALWLADQASDLLLELLPIDASGLATIFGVPSPEQRERAAYVAGRMNALMVQAEVEIERTIYEIESRPDFRNDEKLRRQRRRLVRDERDRRIPLLRGIAACLFAEIAAPTAAARTEHRSIAVELLAPLSDLLTGLPARRAVLYGGLALVRQGRHDEAAVLLRRVTDDPDSTKAEAFAAQSILSQSRRDRDGARAGLAALEAMTPDYAAPEDLFYRVLLADQRYRMRREMTRGARTRSGDHPVNVYVDLLARERDLPAESVRALVLGKIADAVASTKDLRDLPAIATIARADRLSRDERRRPEAVILFEQALDRVDLADGDRAVALYGLGRALHAMNRSGAAARRFLQVAVEHPGDAQAARAAELAAAILHRLSREHPNDDRVRVAFQQALDTLLDEYPQLPTIGRWRYVAGESALAQGAFEDADVHFARIDADDPQYVDAVFMRVNLRRASLALDEDGDGGFGGAEDLVERAADAEQVIEKAVAGADEDRRRDLQYYVAHLRVFRAESFLAMGRPSAAIEALTGIERQPGVDGTVLAAALRVRIDAYQETGRASDARGEILRFMAAAPEEAGAVLDSMLALTLRDIETMLARGREDEAREKAREEGVPLASLLEEWIAGHASAREDRQRYLTGVATAYRLAGRFDDGLAIFDRLAAAQPDTVEILFGRAECLYGLGSDRFAEAMLIYKRLAAGGPGIGKTYYWQSQLRMLLVLDRMQKNTEKIVPRINRLRMTDETLGGLRFRREFDRLANKYS